MPFIIVALMPRFLNSGWLNVSIRFFLTLPFVSRIQVPNTNNLDTSGGFYNLIHGKPSAFVSYNGRKIKIELNAWNSATPFRNHDGHSKH